MKKYTSPFKIYWITSFLLFGSGIIFLWWAVSRIGLHFDELKIYFLILYLTAINFTIGSLYFWDKIIANTKITRVPEIILQTLALLGGSPMALISQKLFRHKTSKKSFQLIYWLIVLLQVGIIWYILFHKLTPIN